MEHEILTPETVKQLRDAGPKDLVWLLADSHEALRESNARLREALGLSRERATLILRIARSAGVGLDEKNALSKIEHEAEHWLGITAALSASEREETT